MPGWQRILQSAIQRDCFESALFRADGLQLSCCYETAGSCRCVRRKSQRMPFDSTAKATEEYRTRRKNCSGFFGRSWKSKICAIAKKLQVSQEEVWNAIEHIRELNPNPLSGCGNGEKPIYVTPDVTVVKFEDHYEILINDYVYPVIHLNQDYVQMMQNQPDEETRIYLKEKIHQAEELQKNIGRRNETMLKLTKCILEVPGAVFQKRKKATCSIHNFRSCRTDECEYINCKSGCKRKVSAVLLGDVSLFCLFFKRSYAGWRTPD